MRAKNLCLLVVISFPYFITRLLTPRCASRGVNRFLVRQFALSFLYKSSRKLVLASAERITSCLENYAKSYAGGTRKLFSAQRQLQEHLFHRLGQPIYTGRAAILGRPAFQAGSRGFEPHLPLHTVNHLSTSPHKLLEDNQAVTENLEGGLFLANRCGATTYLAKCTRSCFLACPDISLNADRKPPFFP